MGDRRTAASSRRLGGMVPGDERSIVDIAGILELSGMPVEPDPRGRRISRRPCLSSLRSNADADPPRQCASDPRDRDGRNRGGAGGCRIRRSLGHGPVRSMEHPGCASPLAGGGFSVDDPSRGRVSADSRLRDSKGARSRRHGSGLSCASDATQAPCRHQDDPGSGTRQRCGARPFSHGSGGRRPDSTPAHRADPRDRIA